MRGGGRRDSDEDLGFPGLDQPAGLRGDRGNSPEEDSLVEKPARHSKALSIADANGR